jgi:hypothetical protein
MFVELVETSGTNESGATLARGHVREKVPAAQNAMLMQHECAGPDSVGDEAAPAIGDHSNECRSPSCENLCESEDERPNGLFKVKTAVHWLK